MDDDDYYPPEESILARVKSLVKYREKGIKCVGCSLIGTYDLVSGKSSMSSDGPISLSRQVWHITRVSGRKNISIIQLIRVNTNILLQEIISSIRFTLFICSNWY